jgi:hypothetical protein
MDLRAFVDAALAVKPGDALQLTEEKRQALLVALREEISSAAGPNAVFIHVPIQIIA